MLYIPNDITIGFKSLPNSFSGKKGFITYKEIGKKEDVLLNQNKFNDWIDNPKDTITIKNKPTSGFVINKQMSKEHYYLGTINTILVYHPEGFEFEISLSNLMHLLEHSDVNSQEIKTECVLGWDNNYPYLITTNCKEYVEAKQKSDQIIEVSDLTDLVVGRTYYTKKEKNLIYIGKEDILKIKDINNPLDISSRKGHIFLKNNSQFVSLAKCQAAYNDEIHPNIADIQEMYSFQKSLIHFTPNKTNLVLFSGKYFSNLFLNNLQTLPESNKDQILFTAINQLTSIFSFNIYSHKLKQIINICLKIDQPRNDFININFQFYYPNCPSIPFYTINQYHYNNLIPDNLDVLIKEFDIKEHEKTLTSYLRKLFNYPNEENLSDFITNFSKFIEIFDFVGFEFSDTSNSQYKYLKKEGYIVDSKCNIDPLNNLDLFNIKYTPHSYQIPAIIIEHELCKTLETINW